MPLLDRLVSINAELCVMSFWYKVLFFNNLCFGKIVNY